jgi:hypothetical protein
MLTQVVQYLARLRYVLTNSCSSRAQYRATLNQEAYNRWSRVRHLEAIANAGPAVAAGTLHFGTREGAIGLPQQASLTFECLAKLDSAGFG